MLDIEPKFLTLVDIEKDNSVFSLLDMRKPEDFTISHLAGAKNIDSDNIGDWLPLLDKSKHYVVICYKGISAVDIAKLLTGYGFTASVLKDGMSALEENNN